MREVFTNIAESPLCWHLCRSTLAKGLDFYIIWYVGAAIFDISYKMQDLAKSYVFNPEHSQPKYHHVWNPVCMILLIWEISILHVKKLLVIQGFPHGLRTHWKSNPVMKTGCSLCSFFSQRKTCFHLQGFQLMRAGFSLCAKTLFWPCTGPVRDCSAPHEGINQANLKIWTNVEDKICFDRTYLRIWEWELIFLPCSEVDFLTRRLLSLALLNVILLLRSNKTCTANT